MPTSAAPPPRREPGSSARRRVRWGRLVWIFALTVVLGGAVAATLYGESLAKSLPSVTGLEPLAGRGTTIYDLKGKAIYTLQGTQNRQPVPLSQIPLNLQHAIIAAEDKRFYQNHGFDILGLIRSVLADIRHQAPVQGASTITEQLAKILYLKDNRSLSYKIKELILGVELSRYYTKSEVLEMYLNNVYLGQGTFGVGAAAEAYFGKPVSQLDLAQCALLAGLPQAPSLYDPYVNPKLARMRQAYVLDRMVAQGYITRAQARAAEAEPLQLASATVNTSYPDPYFIDDVIRILLQHFPESEIYNGGLKVYTTLRPSIYQDIQHAMNAELGQPRVPIPEPEAAAVVMDPHTGYVLAEVGGRTHPVMMGLNRANSSLFLRQTGSAIKPLAEYTTAIEQGESPSTIIDDGPWMLLHGKPWPHNDNYVYQGRIPMSEALAISDNNASVRLLHRVGINAAFNTATKKFGLPLVSSGPKNDRNLAMGIGGLTRGVTPMQMVDAYATFPNMGSRPTPILVRKVTDSQGNLLWADPPHLTPEITPQVAYLMIKMMEGVVKYGTGDPVAQIGRPDAGKTGTSSGGADCWFVGFTPQLVMGVWEGYDTVKPQPGGYGATLAAPIWRYVMMAALRHQPVEHFTRPSGLITVNVDTKSGLLPSRLTPRQYIRPALFIKGNQPTRVSNVWVQEKVLKNNHHLLWEPGCPGKPVMVTFLRRPTNIFIGPNFQLPVDAKLWPPTRTCTGAVVGHGSIRIPGGFSGSSGGGTGSSTASGQGSSSSASPQGANPSSPGTTPSGSGQGTGSGAGSTQGTSATGAVTINIVNGAFTPQSVNVAPNQPVTLTVINQDSTQYRFSLPAMSVENQPIPAHSAVNIEVNTGPPGVDLFYLATVPPAQGLLNVQ